MHRDSLLAKLQRRGFLGSLIILTGCASIVDGSNQPLSVITPGCKGASCEVSNDKGRWFVQETPGSVTVHRSYNDLIVKCTKDQTVNVATVPSKTKGMAFGNILFGGIIGAGVDASTGAAYDYPTEINVPLQCGTPETVAAPGTAAGAPAAPALPMPTAEAPAVLNTAAPLAMPMAPVPVPTAVPAAAALPPSQALAPAGAALPARTAGPAAQPPVPVQAPAPAAPAAVAASSFKLGIKAKEVMLDAQGLPSPSGVKRAVMVTALDPGEAAELAGMRAQDVLVAVDGESIQGLEHLKALMGRLHAASQIYLNFLRDGKFASAHVKRADAKL